MTKQDREWYEGQIEWHKNQLESSKRMLVSDNNFIKKQRERDREMIDWVWSKGVVTKTQMEIYNPKTFKSEDMKRYLNWRRHEYKQIKWHKEYIQKFERYLAEA